MPWLAVKMLGLPRYLWLILAAAALAAIALYFVKAEEADDKANQEIGAAVQRESNQRAVIERAEQADVVREAINRVGPAGDQLRYDQCMQNDRGAPASCERFLPREQGDPAGR